MLTVKARDRVSRRLFDAYVFARHEVIKKGYWGEIDWQARRVFSEITESVFLREAAWVILNSGMRERVVARSFGLVTEAFCGWSSSKAIIRRKSACRRQALIAFGHQRKVDAICAMAEVIANIGFDRVKNSIESDGVSYLQMFQYIGPVTSYHLAKNIGLDVVKPDRHLIRVTAAAGFSCPSDMCKVIGDATGDRVGVVDIVIWRFASFTPGYERHFRC